MTPTSRSTIEQALMLIFELQKWADHKQSCFMRQLSDSNPASDFCNCGYGEAMRRFKSEYEELRRP